MKVSEFIKGDLCDATIAARKWGTEVIVEQLLENTIFKVLHVKYTGEEEATEEKQIENIELVAIVYHNQDKHGYYIVEFDEGSNYDWKTPVYQQEFPD